ncbi:MAG TPA: hypothetical protein VK915_01485 [Gaiellaceae bacterium]|nr:hypothetical protein [Gaiellaceae bacterium]
MRDYAEIWQAADKVVDYRAHLVDDCRLFLAPVLVGGGKQALPEGVRLELQLLDERRFYGGMVYPRYPPSPAARSSPGTR